MSPSRTRLLDLAAVLALVVLAFFLRRGQLAIPHDRGDQLIFCAIARNVADGGLPWGNRVRGIDLAWAVVPDDPAVALVRFHPMPGRGTLVDGLVKSGEAYWDAPLANQPPAFPVLLAFSHGLLGRREDGFNVLGRSPLETWTPAKETALARRLAASPPAGVVRAQLWATLLPLASDLATCVLLYALAARVAGRRAAILATVAYATDPLALLAAHRILSNATLATACLGCVALWTSAEERRGRERLLRLGAAGLVAGVAILVKASALFLVPAGVIVLLARREVRAAVAFALPALALAAPWWLLQWRVLGHPLGLAWEQQKDWAAQSSWANVVLGRGPGYYLGVLGASPLVALGAIGSLGALARVRSSGGREGTLAFAALFALLVLGAAQFHSGGKEARHLLHVYPALLLAGSAWVEPLRRAVGRRGDVLIIALVGAVAFWQAQRGLAAAFDVAGIPP